MAEAEKVAQAQRKYLVQNAEAEAKRFRLEENRMAEAETVVMVYR